jgi:hypothetical protein
MADAAVDRAYRSPLEQWIGDAAFVVLELLRLLGLRPFISALGYSLFEQWAVSASDDRIT